MLIAFLLTAWWPFIAHSAQVEGLYSAAVEVPARDEAVRASALNRALARVLVKVSGSAAVLHPEAGQEALAAALGNAQALVQAFDFQEQGDKIYLNAVFDAHSIDRLLADNGLSIWGRERPATLVWLALDQAGKRYLLGSDAHGEIAESLYAAARLRGIPVNLPIMDIKDRQALSYSDVSGGFTDRVMAASEYYGDRSVLIGHLRQLAAGQWDASWIHILAGSEQRWDVRGQTLSAALQAGVDGSADGLAVRYAARAGVSEQFMLQVNGLRTIGDYARVLNYLQGLSVVSDVQPLLVQNQQVQFQLDVQGDSRTLLDVVALGAVLQRHEAASAESALVFDLLP